MAVITNFPTANTAYSGAGLTNPNNGHADDGVYATCAPAKNGALGQKYQTFGFDSNLPSDATVTAVKIIYEYKVSTTASIATARTKAIISAVEEENHDDTTEPTTDTVKTIDITADRTWTRANLLNAAFEVVLEGRRGNNNTAVTFSFDYVKVEVTYTQPVTNFQTLSATATILATLALANIFVRTLSASVSALATVTTVFTKLITLSSSIAAIGTLSTASIFIRTLSSTVVGAATLTSAAVFYITMNAAQAISSALSAIKQTTTQGAGMICGAVRTLLGVG